MRGKLGWLLALFLAAAMPGIQCRECKRPAFYFTRWVHKGEKLGAELVVWPDGRSGIKGEVIRCHWCAHRFIPTEEQERWFDTKTLRAIGKPR
jgi:DNA-directed RNA polymerase subunit RPC12/RpoP